MHEGVRKAAKNHSASRRSGELEKSRDENGINKIRIIAHVAQTGPIYDDAEAKIQAKTRTRCPQRTHYAS